MGTIADSAHDVVDHLRAAGAFAAGAVRRDQLPAVSRGRVWRQRWRDAKSVAVIERTDEPAASANPLTREIKAALADPRPPANAYRASSRRRPVSARATSHRPTCSPSSTGWATKPEMMRARPYAVLGVKHPPWPSSTAEIELRPRGAYSLRGHSIGGYGSVTVNKLLATGRRRPVRAVRAGVPALRLGEARPAHDLLPDHRRGAHPPAQRAAPGRVRAAPRRVRIRPGRSADRAWSTAGPCSSTAACPIRPRSGRRCPPTREPRSSAARSTSSRSTPPRSRAASRPHRDLAVRMQGAALVGVFLRVAPFCQGSRPTARRR